MHFGETERVNSDAGDSRQLGLESDSRKLAQMPEIYRLPTPP